MQKMKSKFALIALLVSSALTVHAQDREPPDAIVIHPIFSEPFYNCGEHAGSLNFQVGDALGKDCFIMAFDPEIKPLWLRAHSGDGTKNEHWYGWRKDVLSPCDCVIKAMHHNEKTNTPGEMIPGRASSIVFERPDGVMVLLAHVRETTIKVGQQVQAGEVVARVGNNGYSRHPHIHIGAWREDEPLQIRFNQYEMTPQ